jgi:hypothetical protein
LRIGAGHWRKKSCAGTIILQYRKFRENAERMLLASFVAGLSDEIEKLTRNQNPQNVNQALTTALTIREVLRQE